MRLLTRATALLVALAMVMFAFGTGAATAAPQTSGTATAPVTGTTAAGDAFTGNLAVTKFVRDGSQLLAVGTITGTATDPTTGVVTQTVTAAPVQIPVNLAASTGSCQILDLVLGPLDLNLLGLVVHLDQVHLNITAQSGPGNLLGNLLCAVAGLLNGPSPLAGLLGGITALLNQILGALG
jgi:hypothetical protein